jgi:hypothetical protein
MSYGKCWYSESPDPQSFFDVDHYRPKLAARRSPAEVDLGYEWLAFSWDNFRISAQRSNRWSKNELTGETEGKGDWFPLLKGSPKASWQNRCEKLERPALLDPVHLNDVRLLSVLDDGRMGPSAICVGSGKRRVRESCKRYGLNLPALVEARKRVLRDVAAAYDILIRTVSAVATHDEVADGVPVLEQAAELTRRTAPDAPYSQAARAHLIRMGGGVLCAQ